MTEDSGPRQEANAGGTCRVQPCLVAQLVWPWPCTDAPSWLALRVEAGTEQLLCRQLGRLRGLRLWTPPRSEQGSNGKGVYHVTGSGFRLG